MPPRGSRKHQANPHNPRHENGLAQPGKKIDRNARDKGNGHLNGSTRPATTNSTSHAHRHPSVDTTEVNHEPLLQNGTVPYAGKEMSYAVGEARTGSETVIEAVDGLTDKGYVAERSHRQIDVNAARDPSLRSKRGTLTIITSILRSCPLSDTIAILIILLQLPPTILTVIHFLFATLTFVPSSAAPTSAIPSISDLLQGSSGTPSLATIAIADLVFLAIWLFLWAPAQNFAFDFAQAVIAISLGGSTGKRVGAQSTVVCLGFILTSQVALHKDLRPPRLSFLSPSSSSDNAHFPRSHSHSATSKSYSGWIRSILAVHILTQGLVRIVRRWISRREATSTPPAIKKPDPEALAGSPGLSDKVVNADTERTLPHSPARDGHGTSTVPVIKDSREKMSSGKKKRKQSTQVRNQQPLWAALASTKVVVMKEYETSQAAAEAAESKAIDVNNLGNAPFTSEEGSVWISHVGTSDLSFSTSIREPVSGAGYEEAAPRKSTTTIDRSKPFFIRINKTDWGSTRIWQAGKTGSDFRATSSWAGEVSGLTPLTSYEVEFVRTKDSFLLFTASVTTLPEPEDVVEEEESPVPDPDTPTAASTTSPPQAIVDKSIRPSSPTTTLLKSIGTAETVLADEKARLKRVRKERKAHGASLKKEVDSASARLISSGSGDDRQRQRVLQIRQHIRQAEDTALAVCSQVEGLGPIPEQDTRGWKQQREHWDHARERFADARAEIDEDRAGEDRLASAAQAEASVLHQKHERLQSRIAKLNEQHDRITSAKAQGLSEKERMAADTARKVQERQTMELNYLEQVQGMHQAVQETQFASQQLWQQIHLVETTYREQQQTGSTGSIEGSVPPTLSHQPLGSGNNSTTHFSTPSFPSYNPSPAHGPAFPPVVPRQTRGRSSSMLSSASGFTDVIDPTDADVAPVDEARRLNGSTERSSPDGRPSPKDARLSPARHSPLSAGEANGRVKGKGKAG
ncbi:MAG: hypothetical protein M1817_002757 [Caeruleum heppii]|nr:MAG: hypothetical protein M1817_002757 [Caeruleum heppii]